MKNKLLTIAASTVLIIYASYKIIQILVISFERSYYPFTSFGQRLINFLTFSIYSWGLLALGLCGLMLVYADLNMHKDLDFQKRITKIKNIVFSTLIIFSICMIFSILYTSFTSYQMYQNSLEKGYDTVNDSFVLIITSIAVGFVISIGKILYGTYIILKKESLLKPFLIIYFAGIAYSFMSRTYGFINAIIYNNNLLSDASKIELFGINENRINSLTISFAVDILILLAGLIIVLYGIKKEKLPVTEDAN